MERRDFQLMIPVAFTLFFGLPALIVPLLLPGAPPLPTTPTPEGAGVGGQGPDLILARAAAAERYRSKLAGEGPADVEFFSHGQ
jgi:hypothetical protein